MPARNAMQLRADGETPEILRTALADLNELKPTPRFAESIRLLRAELEEELRNIEGRLL